MNIPNPQTVPNDKINTYELLSYLRRRITKCKEGIQRAKNANNSVSCDSWQDQYAALTQIYLGIVYKHYKS